MAEVRERRQFLRVAASTVTIVVAGCASTKSIAASGASSGQKESDEGEVTPGEDLMQEHGVLERVLLVYEEAARRIESKETLDPSVVTAAADIVRRFIAEYHEKQEEQFVFPRLQAAKRETELVAILLRQHERGRRLTEEIHRRSQASAAPELAQLLRAFSHMYRPHAAREDTVLFPAFRKLVGRSGYHELAEQFEDREHELFGEHGFETFVSRVSELEQTLGIGDLERFTPA